MNGTNYLAASMNMFKNVDEKLLDSQNANGLHVHLPFGSCFGWQSC